MAHFNFVISQQSMLTLGYSENGDRPLTETVKNEIETLRPMTAWLKFCAFYKLVNEQNYWRSDVLYWGPQSKIKICVPENIVLQKKALVFCHIYIFFWSILNSIYFLIHYPLILIIWFYYNLILLSLRVCTPKFRFYLCFFPVHTFVMC